MLFRSSAAADHPRRIIGKLAGQVRIRGDQDDEPGGRETGSAASGSSSEPSFVSAPLAGSVVEDDADGGAEIVQLAALLGIAGDVHFALWRTMAGEARLD